MLVLKTYDKCRLTVGVETTLGIIKKKFNMQGLFKALQLNKSIWF